MEQLYFRFIVAFIIAGFLLDFITNTLNINNWRPHLPEKLRGFFDDATYRRARSYGIVRFEYSTLHGSIQTVLLIIFLLAGGFDIIDAILRNITDHPVLLAILFFGVISFGSDLADLPFQLYSVFVIEQRFGFNRTNARTFFADKLKGYLIGGFFGSTLLFLILEFYTAFGRNGWLLAWAGVTIVLVFINGYFATLILPLFNRLAPLESGSLRKRIERYAESIRFPIENIFVMDGSKRSSRANAFFSGFGRRKKIVLYDTLIEKHTEEELVAILAHEVGHYRKRHIMQGLILSILGAGFTLFLLFQFLSDPAASLAIGIRSPGLHGGLLAFALLYIPVSILIDLPVRFLMRRNEFQADRFAGLTSNAEDLSSALKKLSLDNLSNPDPHPLYVFFHYTHPPVIQRIDRLRRMAS